MWKRNILYPDLENDPYIPVYKARCASKGRHKFDQTGRSADQTWRFVVAKEAMLQQPPVMLSSEMSNRAAQHESSIRVHCDEADSKCKGCTVSERNNHCNAD